MADKSYKAIVATIHLAIHADGDGKPTLRTWIGEPAFNDQLVSTDVLTKAAAVASVVEKLWAEMEAS